LIYVPFLVSRLDTQKNDFNAVYIWSAAARKGMNPYVDDLTRLESQLGIDDNGNPHANYPPPLILAFEPDYPIAAADLNCFSRDDRQIRAGR
jgi:hypothetical protein